VDGLHVEIDNINDLLMGFCFIRSIDYLETFTNIRKEGVEKDFKGNKIK
jgi:hypothetical protein